MRSIMDTYKELLNQRQPSTGLEIFFEYVSSYRRVLLLRRGNGWMLKVAYRGLASRLRSWEKTYGDKQDAVAWTIAHVSNRVIIIGALTIKESIGKININRIATLPSQSADEINQEVKEAILM